MNRSPVDGRLHSLRVANLIQLQIRGIRNSPGVAQAIDAFLFRGAFLLILLGVQLVQHRRGEGLGEVAGPHVVAQSGLIGRGVRLAAVAGRTPAPVNGEDDLFVGLVVRGHVSNWRVIDRMMSE